MSISNLTLTRHTILSDVETPVSLFHKISQGEPTAFLLESTEGVSRLARYSFIGIDPVKTVCFKQGRAMLHEHPSHPHTTAKIITVENPLAVLQQELQKYNAEAIRELAASLDAPFLGGWVGYMGYGATRYFDNIPQQENSPCQVPDGSYGLYDSILQFDHVYRTITFLSFRESAEAEALWGRIQARITESPSLLPLHYEINAIEDDRIFQGVQAPWDEKQYMQAVQKAKEFIREGQVFQLVLAHRFSTTVHADPIQVYRLVQSINPSPYAYYLKYPDFVYLGSSPETFVTCRDGQVILRALAGTRPRGRTEEEDIALEAELRANEKELAEHRMLVDLARNDLGRFCHVGTVEVGEIATVTRYTHVMHLATEIQGRLRENASCFNVFQSCFPRGTVSGAPKIRAMHLLSELEPEQRGVYSGVVGYFDFLGNMDGAIAIRSTLIKDKMAHVHAGAGIVFDSDPLMEYYETRNKAKSILKAIQLAERVPAQHHEPRRPVRP